MKIFAKMDERTCKEVNWKMHSFLLSIQMSYSSTRITHSTIFIREMKFIVCHAVDQLKDSTK